MASSSAVAPFGGSERRSSIAHDVLHNKPQFEFRIVVPSACLPPRILYESSHSSRVAERNSRRLASAVKTRDTCESITTVVTLTPFIAWQIITGGEVP